MVKCKLCPGQKQLHYAANNQLQLSVNICTDSMLTQTERRTQSDVKAERVPTSAQQPEPDLQQVTLAVTSSQAHNTVASISTCTRFHSRITVAIALKSL